MPVMPAMVFPTTVAILGAGTIAVIPGATPVPGSRSLPTVQLTAAGDLYPGFDGTTASITQLLKFMTGNLNNPDWPPDHISEYTASLVNTLLANGYYDVNSSGVFYNPDTSNLVIPAIDAHVYHLDLTTGDVYDPANPNLIYAHINLDTGDVYEPSNDPNPVPDTNTDVGDDTLNLGSLTDFFANPIGYLLTLVTQVFTLFGELVNSLLGSFSASAVDPLDALALGAASADAGLLGDLLNDLAAGNSFAAIADVNAELP